MQDKCVKDENQMCTRHMTGFGGGHTEWGNEPVCDWYASMWVHGECMSCPQPTRVERRRKRRERAGA